MTEPSEMKIGDGPLIFVPLEMLAFRPNLKGLEKLSQLEV
jgi:hypothetical protein